MSEWLTTIAIGAPLCVLGYYVHRRVRTHGYVAIFGEFVLCVVLLNFCSAWINASAIVQDDVRKWQKLIRITCPHAHELGPVIQLECNVANRGLARTWIGLFVTALSDIGWLVVLLRVDMLGAFYAIANAHVGVWTTAMTLLAMALVGLIFIARLLVIPAWKGRSKARLAREKSNTAQVLTCTPDPLRAGKLSCQAETPSKFAVSKSSATYLTGPSSSDSVADERFATRDDSDSSE